MKETAVIIVNWNGKHLLKNCLDSAQNQTYQNFELVLVDNGSQDQSVEFVTLHYPWVKILSLDQNTGFAKGNNLGIREALKKKEIRFIVLVNNDTKMAEDFLEKLVEQAKRDSYAGAVAPKVKYFYEPDLIDSVGISIHKDGGGLNRGNKEKDQGQYDKIEEVFGPCGGAVLYKRELIEDISIGKEFFDEDFFAYYEDLDVAWRARLRGWKTITCPEAVVWHIHSATAISYSSFKAFYVNRNRFFVIIKNYPFGLMIWALLFLTPFRYFHLLNSIRRKKGPSHKLKEKTSFFEPFRIVLRGWFEVMRFFLKMLKKRRYIQKRRKVSLKEVENWFRNYSAKLEDMIYK